jgi:hypothetical protein
MITGKWGRRIRGGEWFEGWIWRVFAAYTHVYPSSRATVVASGRKDNSDCCALKN